jgi:hypothetical protein
MLSKYQNARGKRREAITKTGRFRGGKLNPVMAVAVRPSEGGMLSQTATMELDPIGGRMITPITGEIISVFVPVQAIDEIKAPAAAYAGATEVIREKLLTGNPLFALETEGEITQRCGIEPRAIGGVKKVNEAVRLAHNVAVNHLRQRRFDKATLLLYTNTAVTPAILSETVLDRLNGVLDPDDRVNGLVNLDVNVNLPAMSLPLDGLGIIGTPSGTRGVGLAVRGDTTAEDYTSTASNTHLISRDSATANDIGVTVKVTGTGATTRPAVFAKLNATALPTQTGNVSLTDFYNAETMDRITREMDKIIKDNPEYGEEMVLRWAHGLSVDTGKTPFVIAEQRAFFQRNIVGAMDSAGVNGEVIRSDFLMQMQFTVPVPKTELGGVIITFLVVKPDETLATQPHPILSDVWGVDNHTADELMLDPVPVTGRELDSGISQALETTVMLYTGNNALKQAYMHYGFTRNTNLTTVASKTAIWQLQVPLSVTPSSVLYPDTLSHYPFADQNAEVVTYTIASMATIETPMIFGPTPVENIATVTSQDLFNLVP